MAKLSPKTYWRAIGIIGSLIGLGGVFVWLILPKLDTQRFSRVSADFDPGQFLILTGSLTHEAAGQVLLTAVHNDETTTYQVIASESLLDYLTTHPEAKTVRTLVASRYFEDPNQPLFVVWIGGQTLSPNLGAIPFLQGPTAAVTDKHLSDRERACLTATVSPERLAVIRTDLTTPLSEEEMISLLSCFPKTIIAVTEKGSR